MKIVNFNNLQLAVFLHPKTQFPACCSRCYPILGLMENRNSRDSRNTVTSKLCELCPISCEYVDEPIHVANDHLL
jgi:hypothetical protein